MTYETIAVERDGPIMTVRFNRPGKRNAINYQMHQDIRDVCRALGDDFDTRVVIFTGEGAGFSSGADTSEWRQPTPDNELAVRSLSGSGSRTSAAIENLEQITIAAIHGFAVGGAVVLTLCCDFRIAGESAWFSIPEVELGLPLSWNALPRLARAVGHAKALELTVLCERFSASEAHAWGLVTHLVPDSQELQKAREIAGKVVAMPALPVALTKASMNAIRRGTEIGDVAYGDPEMLQYSRLMNQRTVRRQRGRESK
ncbi:MAG: enoyl-CoA hydratase/isomerase family protein [Dehalococcoidia bacterium]